MHLFRRLGKTPPRSIIETTLEYHAHLNMVRRDGSRIALPDGICNLSCSVTSCEIGQDNITKLCGQNCSQTYSPLVYQCIEREHKENIRSQTCNTTKFNLISSEEDFVTKQTCLAKVISVISNAPRYSAHKIAEKEKLVST